MIARSNTRISNFSLLPHSLIIFMLLLLIFPALVYAQDALWTKIEGPWEQELDGFFQSITINPNNGKVVYIGNTNGGGIYKTVDGGDTWIEINSGLPQLRFTSNYFPIRALVIDPSSPNTLYAGTSTSDPYSTPGLMGRGIYKSVNAGVSWSQANSSGDHMLSGTSGTLLPIFTIRVDPKKSDTLYAGLRFGGIWKSTDGGNNWTETNNGLHKDAIRGLDIDILAVDPVNTNVVYAAGNVTDIFQYGPLSQGIYKSIDAGNSWAKLNTGTIIKPVPYTALVSSLTINPNNPSILYFATTSKGIYKSMDGGITWSETNGVGNNKLPKNPFGYLPIECLVIDPLLSDTIYAGLISGGVYKSVDGGTNWLPFNEGLNNATVRTLAFASNSSSHILYATTTEGIFKVNLAGDVRGYVKDSTTNHPINEALIKLYHENGNYTGKYAHSNSPNGHFKIRNVPVANYYLTITKSGYSSTRDPKARTFYVPTTQEEQGVPEEYWGLNRGDIYLTPLLPKPLITFSLQILESPPFHVGDTITSVFTIINKGEAPITFEVLTVGGRGPEGETNVQDFDWHHGITLNSNDSYDYRGNLILTKPGKYHFFPAYRTPDGNWNSSIPAKEGIIGTLDIQVTTPFAHEAEIKLKDKSTIKGEIQQEKIKIKTKYGEMDIPVENFISIIGELIKLKDGTTLKGNFAEKVLNVKTDYGKLKVQTKDIDSIIFVKGPEPPAEPLTPAIEGLVLDNFGNSLEDVRVYIEKTTLEAKTNAQGKYSLHYVPGEFAMIATKKGYRSTGRTLTITTSTRFPAEDLVLYKLPEGKGLFVYGDSDYIELKNVKLRKTSEVYEYEERGGITKLDATRLRKLEEYYPAGGPTIIQKAKIRVLDNRRDHVFLYSKLFRLDDVGRVASMQYGEMSISGSLQGNLIDENVRRVGTSFELLYLGEESITLREVTLDEGEYAYVYSDMFGNLAEDYCYYFSVGTPRHLQVQEHYRQGQSYFIKGQYEEAIGEYQKALKISPDRVDIHEWLAELYFLTGKYDSAARAMWEVIFDQEGMKRPKVTQAQKSLFDKYRKLASKYDGIMWVLELDRDKLPAGISPREVLTKNLATIKKRIEANQGPNAENIFIYRQDETRILIQTIGGVKDPRRLMGLAGRTGYLEFKLINEKGDVNKALQGDISKDNQILYDSKKRPYLLKKEILLSGSAVKDARVEIDQWGQPYISLEFKSEAADKWAEITGQHVEERIAIIVDNVVKSAPVIKTRVTEGKVVIEGNFTTEEAQDLAIIIKSGSLAAPLNIIQNTVWGGDAASSFSHGLVVHVKFKNPIPRSSTGFRDFRQALSAKGLRQCMVQKYGKVSDNLYMIWVDFSGITAETMHQIEEEAKTAATEFTKGSDTKETIESLKQQILRRIIAARVEEAIFEGRRFGLGLIQSLSLIEQAKGELEKKIEMTPETEKEVKLAVVKGRVTDALSGDPVWKIRIVIDAKSTIRYKSKVYRLTGIEPGSYTLKATAPNYYDFTKDIKVDRDGEHIVNIRMRGKEIPDLHSIIVFAQAEEKGIQLEIRFLNSKEEGITKFPSLSLDLEGRLYVRLGDKEDYTRGEELFSGPIELFWDSEAFLARNKGIVPWEKIGQHLEVQEYGILDVVLHTPQGNFKDTVDDVKLHKG